MKIVDSKYVSTYINHEKVYKNDGHFGYPIRPSVQLALSALAGIGLNIEKVKKKVLGGIRRQISFLTHAKLFNYK